MCLYSSETEVKKSASRRRSRLDLESDVLPGPNKCSNCHFQSEVSADYHAHLLECGGVTDWDEESKKKKKKKKFKKKTAEGEIKPKKEVDPGKIYLL